MKKLIDDLLLVMAKEKDVYLEALGIAEAKKRVIIDGQIKELEKMTAREQALVATLVKLENMRGKVLQDLVRSLQIEHVDTLNELMLYLDESSKQKIELVKKELSSVVYQLQDRNELNGKLIEQSLDLVNLNIELMTALEVDGRYTQKASDSKAGAKTNLFDAKI